MWTEPTAIERSGERLKEWADKITFVHGNFCDVAAILKELEIPKVNGMLFDLGVSSPQLDEGDRGFSYMADAPLDMRMDQSDTLSAWLIVNKWPQEKLEYIIKVYGEERYARLIASAVIRARSEQTINTTGELVEIIKKAVPAAALREKQHPDQLSFSGGPDREERYSEQRKRMYLPERSSDLYLRICSDAEKREPKTHYRIGTGAGRESESAQRETAHRGKSRITGADYGKKRCI